MFSALQKPVGLAKGAAEAGAPKLWGWGEGGGGQCWVCSRTYAATGWDRVAAGVTSQGRAGQG